MNMICNGCIHIAIWILLLQTEAGGQVGAVDGTQIELVGPKNFVALGDDLKVQYRFTFPLGNISEAGFSSESLLSSCLFFQLTVMESGREVSIAAQRVTEPVTNGIWNKVSFSCGLIVKGGEYHVHLMHKEVRNCTETEEGWDGVNMSIIASVTLHVVYPAIDFEVPTRLETYSASVPISIGLTRSVCKPIFPLPSTELKLSVCVSINDDCSRDFATVFQEPLLALQKDGKKSITIGCELWARNLTYRFQIVEKSPRVVVARSQPIKVEWSSRFSLNVSRTSILPCRGSLRVTVSNPLCLLEARDKIRIQGYETSMVPTLITSGHPFYIGEQLIQPHQKFVNIKCNMFPQRFSRVCFQYVNTAIDQSVAVVLEHCVHMHPIHTTSVGGWGPWSAWSSCSSTCGFKGKQYRFRFCDSPPPTTSSTFCKGNAIEEVACNTGNNCSIGEGNWNHRTEHTLNTESTLLHYEHEDGDDMDGDEMDNEHYDEYEHSGSEEHDGFDSENLWNELAQGHHVNFSFQGTQGCECGCHLRNLTPGVNNTLTVYFQMNDSSCSNASFLNASDNETGGKSQWVLHAREKERRLRVVFMDWSTQCIWLAVRDGETSDSNLLKMISGEKNVKRNGIVVQSNGPAITLLPTHILNSLQTNCSSQFIFFIIYAIDFLPHILENDNGDSLIVDSKFRSRGVGSFFSVETVLVLLLKLVLVILSVALLCSAVGVLATRGKKRGIRRNSQSGKCGGEDSETLGPCEGDGLMGVEASSRSTSVTLMSFDYALWKECRLMKLKYFLLRPRRTALRTKSVPNTPMSSELQIALLDSKSKKLHKSPSYPENDLKGRKRSPMKSLPMRGEKKNQSTTSLKMDKSSQRDKKSEELREKNSCTSEHLKLQKESFNLKRKANERQKEKDVKLTVSSPNEHENNKHHQRNGKDVDNNRGLDTKSPLSFASSMTDFTRSSSHRTGPASQVDLGESIQDFEMEMDYYDYDVANASNIPGSYLALEPTFVLWNSELDSDFGSIHENENISPAIMDEKGSEKVNRESDASTSKD